MIFRSPTLVIEVLSPTTQACDRGRKFAFYRRVETLREYVLIDSESREIQGFRRNAAGEWVLHDMTEDEFLELPCIEVSLPMADVFYGIDWQA